MNSGNVKTKPNIHIDILDYDMKNILKSTDYSDVEVDSTENKTIELKISYPEYWNSGKYWANITTSLKDNAIDNRLVEFELLEESTSVVELNETAISTTTELPEERPTAGVVSERKGGYLNIIIISLLILAIVVIIIYALVKNKEKYEKSPLEKI